MAARPILSILSIIVLAGGILLQFLVILSGAITSDPVNKVYFLQATTSKITGSTFIRDPARWTYFAVCGVKNGLNYNCGKVTAALPFDPVKNFGTSTGVPAAFVGTDRFYLLSRFAWAFYIIALFFAVVALLLSVFALCARIGAFLSGGATAAAFLFQLLAAALMTAWTVLAKKDFAKQGVKAHLGIYAYGFTWGAMGAFLVATILFCAGGGASKSNKNGVNRNRSTRSTRSRGTLADSESQHRVKDEYE